MTPDSATVEELNALEQRRCDAYAAGDMATLTELFDPDMLMVHFRGKTEGRDTYVAAIGKSPRSIEFGPMTIQVYGDTAVMLGKHDITRYRPDGTTHLIDAFAVRVVRNTGDGWRYIHIHVAPSIVEG